MCGGTFNNVQKDMWQMCHTYEKHCKYMGTAGTKQLSAYFY